MPFLDFFRNLLGKGSSAQEPPQYRLEDEQYTNRGDSFRNPIWQTDEDDDDVSDFSSRQPRDDQFRYRFRVFSDPFEMTRFFETQMDDMLRSFFDGFGGGFGSHSGVFAPFGNALPMPDEKPKGPRDEVLKPSYGPDHNGKKSWNDILKPSYEFPDSSDQKIDSDIDGKIQSNELTKIWKNPSQEVEVYEPQFSNRSFGKSVSKQIITRSDGCVEERCTVKDSDGNEEITVTRRIGDKIHKLITKKAKDGSETKTEDIINMDENELKGFDEKWTKICTRKEDRADNFPWSKFFGPNPKL